MDSFIIKNKNKLYKNSIYSKIKTIDEDNIEINIDLSSFETTFFAVNDIVHKVDDSLQDNLEEIYFSDIKKIYDDGIFENCNCLKKVKLSKNSQNISYKMFKNCISLTDIIIPENITTIDSYAFYGCAKLKHIILPDTINYIGEYAFACCKNLKSITFKNKTFTNKNDFNYYIKKIGIVSYSKYDIAW